MPQPTAAHTRGRTKLMRMLLAAFLGSVAALPSGCTAVFIAENMRLVQGTVFWVFVAGALAGSALAAYLIYSITRGTSQNRGLTEHLLIRVLLWGLLTAAIGGTMYMTLSAGRHLTQGPTPR